MRAAVRPQRRGTRRAAEAPDTRGDLDDAVRDFLNEKRAENCSPATVDKIYAWVLPLAVDRLFRRLGDLTGIPKLHPHRCRHHFVTRSLAAGVNPDALRRALGHTTMAMTQRYLSSTETDLLEEWTHRRD